MTTISKILVCLMLGALFIFSFASSWNDSAIFDEKAHIVAGYSYLTQKDMRLNPEHPPLIKDIAALPLTLLNLNFRTDTDAWQKEIDSNQWNQGQLFLYGFGNNPDTILHYARFPIMILAIITGIVLFWWVRSVYGNKTALLATFFYAFSPTVIAHSRFVTTDIGATFAFLISIATFIRFLARPSRTRLCIAGIVFGVAQLMKFSLFLLVPINAILALIWLLAQDEWYDAALSKKERLRLCITEALRLYAKIALICAIGVIIIWAVYLWHVWNFPQDLQRAHAERLIGRFRIRPFVSLDLWLIDHRLTRPLGEYLLGVMMVTQRTAGGNSAYFFGEVSSAGWHSYFPIVYLLKETLAFHILTLTALILALGRLWRAKEKSWRALRGWICDNFAFFSSMFFVALYWTSSVSNPLNIGIRHVLPTFPFIFMLVSRELVLWISGSAVNDIRSFGDWLRALYRTIIAPVPRIFFIGTMCLWIVFSIVVTFPYYLSYYNELGGGTLQGHYYATDSNYDWGQDLKRLRDWGRAHPNETLYLDYFGGGDPSYYLGSQYKGWYSSFGSPPSGSVFAISANALRGNQATPVRGFPPQKIEDTYSWLKGREPFDRAGVSIFLYRIQ